MPYIALNEAIRAACERTAGHKYENQVRLSRREYGNLLEVQKKLQPLSEGEVFYVTLVANRVNNDYSKNWGLWTALGVTRDRFLKARVPAYLNLFRPNHAMAEAASVPAPA